MESISMLKKQWSRLGFRFLEKPGSGFVDVEKLIAETAGQGRSEPVLLWALLTWLVRFSDLVNISRLLRFAESAEQAVLGAILEIALAHKANKKLKYVTAKCRPFEKPELLFHAMGNMAVTRENEIKKALPEFRKWGLYCSSFTIKDDAMHTREWVLKTNRNLLLRAFLGANVRAEIYFFLELKKEAYIRQLADWIGASYQPVYQEIMSMISNRFLNVRTIGRIKLVALNRDSLLPLAV